MRLYAAPAHAVSVMTPVVITICLVRGNIRNSLGIYWNIMLNRMTFFILVTVASFRFGTTTNIRNCNVMFYKIIFFKKNDKNGAL
jgi:hypothetical protein